jgi:LysR family transcriptional regulator, glycine cleavage system transcriptional activator
MARGIKWIDGSPMAETPPLQAIKVFDSVARHLSFTKAAAELAMTQSAVSYQIKLLESFLGAPLFVRLARGVALTERGLSVAPVVRQALGDLNRAFRSAREAYNATLVITTIHTFATNWLAPRIGGFQLAHPDIAVRLDVSSRLIDLESEGFDVAIRHAKEPPQGLVSHFLMDSVFTAVASPAYIERHGPFTRPAQLLEATIIGPSDDWWPVWFETAGVAAPHHFAHPGVDLDTQQMIASVAIAGHGVALVTPGFVADDLKSGRLVQLFDVMGTMGTRYYLLYPESRRNQRKIRVFRDWLLAQAAQ